jgi:hypothetical protein
MRFVWLGIGLFLVALGASIQEGEPLSRLGPVGFAALAPGLFITAVSLDAIFGVPA